MANQNKDIQRLNKWSIVILSLSFLLAWFVWKGVVKCFDGPFGIVREASSNILLEKIALFILIAGLIELFFHKILQLFINKLLNKWSR
jgi:hypothetical protein